MRIFILKQFRPAIFAGLVCLAAAMILSSCSKKKPQEQILGKWSIQGQSSMVDFRKDGTIITTTDGKDSSATYKFVNDTNIEMETSAMVGTNKVSFRIPASLAIRGDTVDLSMMLPQQTGTPPTPYILHLQRAK
jgi:hypothetical protein